MAIQMRRGKKADFDSTKMLPGEWAVSIDSASSKQIIWMCFAAGVVKRMGTLEDFDSDIQELIRAQLDSIEASVESCASSEQSAQESASAASTSASNATSSKNAAASSASAASSSAGAAAGSAQAAATSATGAQNYYQMTEDAISANIPQFTMNLTNGHLSFTGGTMLFQINSAGHLGWEVTV